MWTLERPEVITALQRSYTEDGSDIIYSPTFQANAPALARFGLANKTKSINMRLVSLSRAAAPRCLIAGNLTTLKMYLAPSDERCYPHIRSAYRRQIRTLLRRGVDLLAAKTLFHPSEAIAVLEAAEAENAPAVIISFALKSNGTIRSAMTLPKCSATLKKQAPPCSA